MLDAAGLALLPALSSSFSLSLSLSLSSDRIEEEEEKNRREKKREEDKKTRRVPAVSRRARRKGKKLQDRDEGGEEKSKAGSHLIRQTVQAVTPTGLSTLWVLSFLFSLLLTVSLSLSLSFSLSLFFPPCPPFTQWLWLWSLLCVIQLTSLWFALDSRVHGLQTLGERGFQVRQGDTWSKLRCAFLDSY